MHTWEIQKQSPQIPQEEEEHFPLPDLSAAPQIKKKQATFLAVAKMIGRSSNSRSNTNSKKDEISSNSIVRLSTTKVEKQDYEEQIQLQSIIGEKQEEKEQL